MKAKYALVLWLTGWCAVIVGAVFKIMHWGGANLLLLIGMGLLVVGVLVFLYKLLTYPNFRRFLNR